jgi:hypothetical protein
MINPNIKNKVCLSEEQRQRLKDISRNGTAPVKKVLHAHVLLMAVQEHPEGRWKRCLTFTPLPTTQRNL